MADEKIDLEDEPSPKETHPIDKRINKALSDRDTALAQAAEKEKIRADEEKKRIDAERERDFYKGFSTLVPKHPAAPEYQDKIKEKVMGGYDIEDATISVLAKEGKFMPPTTATPPISKESPAGGSANTTITPASKTVAEMSISEKLDALREEEKKGNLGLS